MAEISPKDGSRRDKSFSVQNPSTFLVCTSETSPPSSRSASYMEYLGDCYMIEAMLSTKSYIERFQ